MIGGGGGVAYVVVTFRRTDEGDRVAFRIAGLISDNGLATTAAAVTLVKAVDNKVNALKQNIIFRPFGWPRSFS